MAQAALVLFWFATALYAGATILYAYHFLSKKRSYSWYATFLTGAGFLCHTASIGTRSSATDGTELTGPNSLVLAAWALVLVYFVVEHLIRLKLYGTALIPLAGVLMIVAQLLGIGSAGGHSGLSPSQALLLESWRVGIHVALIVFANAGFAIGAVASIVYLMQEAQLKSRKSSTLLRRLPSLAQTDVLARRSIAFAFPAYTAGLTLGIVRAIETDVAGWWQDPRVMLAGVVWFVFGTYLYMHYGRGVSGRTTAWVAVVGLVFVVIVAIVARSLPVGFHIFGVAR